MQKKNFTIFGISILSLIFFIIAVIAFGFKGKIGDAVKLPDLENGTGYLKDGYGLMVSGLVLVSIAIIMAGVLIWLASSKSSVQDKNSVNKWLQWTIFGLIILSFVLVFSGVLLVLLKTIPTNAKFNDVWDEGYAAGLLIFTILPLPLLSIPFFIKN